MKYDIELDIATGQSRKQKTWKNQKMMWSELAHKLASTKRTKETVEEYKKLPKVSQDEIKDVGGFVGGYLNNGQRTKVRHRQVIALDIDFGDETIWDDFNLIYDYGAVMYSTHKYTKESPRLRLIIPLDRPVDCDEYQAIARQVANTLNIDAFDDTTFQPQRLMYWPSTSKDGEFVYEVNDSQIMPADEILNYYVDWRDITSWPTSSRANDIVRSNVGKQQDPTTKNGLIGAFCRAYDIHSAIDNFIDDYEPCNIPGRYTYAKGSTVAGIVTYDDMFSYSHHGTDPASSVLCNAFDLVRLHKFKELDKDIKENTPVNKWPSFIAMEDFASKDSLTKKELINSITAEFDAIEDNDTEAETVEEDEWVNDLEVSRQGKILPTYKNLETILLKDKNLKGRFGFNKLSKQEVIVGKFPWTDGNGEETAITDNDDANIRVYLEKKYGVTAKDKIYDVVNTVCHKNTFHPIKDYLESLKWDGIERVDRLLIDYFACSDSEYVRAVTRKTLLGAVTRIYRPGCQFDSMLTLKGSQGNGKSSFFRKLSNGWFMDAIPDIRNKDALEALQGVWIVEFAELTAMKKADAETIKSFITTRIDRFRRSYGRRTQNFPRQCIFVATTNESEFLRDKTGNRRFWIVDTPKGKRSRKSPFDLSQDEVNQIWAEAKWIYDNTKETLYLDAELEKEARSIQEAFMLDDPRVMTIMDYLNRLLPENWDSMDLYDRQEWLASDEVGTVERTKVCAAEVWCEALGYPDRKKLNQYEVSEINKIIDNLSDWRKHTSSMRFAIYGTQRGFRKVQQW